MSMTNRDRVLLAMLAILAIVGAFWFLALKPKRAEVAKLNDRVAKKEGELKGAKQQVATFEAARDTYASDYTTVVRLGEAVPEDDSIPSLLVQLDSLAGKKIDFTQVGINKYPPPMLGPSLSGTPAEALGIPQGGEVLPTLMSGATGATPGASGAGIKGVSDEKPGTPSGSSSSESSKGAGSGTEAPDAKTQQASLPFQPLKITLQFQGNFFKLQKLFKGMDRMVRLSKKGKITVGGRLLFIEGFKWKESRFGFPYVAVSMSALAFSLPEGEGLTGGATPSAPSGGGSQLASSEGSSSPDSTTTPSTQ